MDRVQGQLAVHFQTQFDRRPDQPAHQTDTREIFIGVLSNQYLDNLDIQTGHYDRQIGFDNREGQERDGRRKPQRLAVFSRKKRTGTSRVNLLQGIQKRQINGGQSRMVGLNAVLAAMRFERVDAGRNILDGGEVTR
ncbi:MAG: hypothetical protein QNI97_11580 [Desulfobacterales bacterium]|nr:hypothetical protein [Desulfobacterales bacterium]